MQGERPAERGCEVWRAVWSEWEGPGQPPPAALSEPCTSVLPACLRSVSGLIRQCLQTESPEADASVGEAQATSPSARVTPVHTGEPNAAPFCFLGILMTSPG